jgi:hypothetical protein
VKLLKTSTLQEVAATVGAHLASRGIRAVLTGGACVAIHTGTYVSKDADFVLQSVVTRRALDEALEELGFLRRGSEYVHPVLPFWVEFPPGPLSIGDDLAIVPVELTVGHVATLGLSATDSCRDRLAAFYHWYDRQALTLAVGIARVQPVDLEVIRRWSTREGKTAEFDEFVRQVGASTLGASRTLPTRRPSSRGRQRRDDRRG